MFPIRSILLQGSYLTLSLESKNWRLKKKKINATTEIILPQISMLLAELEFNGSELENRNTNKETSLCLLTPHCIKRKGVEEAPWSQS